MGLFSLFWDIRQDQEIRDAKDAADRSARRTHSAQEDVGELRAGVDRLALVNQALWELLRDRTELTDADLKAKVEEVDRRDGRLDGRAGPGVATCPQCAKPNAETRGRCLYCGTTLPGAGAREASR